MLMQKSGAGKSSLVLALFRFINASRGRILVDGLDISHIKLDDLRSRLAVIPQDPVLFSGTVRSNLDPFGRFSDLELQSALERVHLAPSDSDSPEATDPENPSSENPDASSSTAGQPTHTPAATSTSSFTLASPIHEAGLNLSAGQRQLLCLARALAQRPRLLVLDEATSAVDAATDARIQHSIRADFGRGTTMLVIAHRLSTVADFDKVLVLSEGSVLEFGSPRELYEKEDGAFRGLVEGSGEREVLRGMFGES